MRQLQVSMDFKEILQEKCRNVLGRYDVYHKAYRVFLSLHVRKASYFSNYAKIIYEVPARDTRKVPVVFDYFFLDIQLAIVGVNNSEAVGGQLGRQFLIDDTRVID